MSTCTDRAGDSLRARGAGTLLERADRFSRGALGGLGRIGGWTAALSGSLVAAVCSQALAGPEGAKVARGNVSITRDGTQTIIRASNGSIINYRGFDIAKNESVRFIQPNSLSRVLNRIQSATPTRIDGSLFANGRVYIVNPAGVVFGNGATVNVNRLYAAAGNISDADYGRGISRFTNLSGEVVNAGQISADFGSLVGARTANIGTIVAPAGTVVMGSGKDVLIGERTGNIFVRVSGETAGTADTPAVENAGTIDAPRGRVIMGAGDAYAIAVRNSGTVTARNIRLEGQGSGEVHVHGTLDASNQGKGGTGGEVRVLGEKVGLGGATVDASGDRGGGTVLIGGNYQGKGPERNAEQALVTADSTIRADAGATGNGGTIVVWSDKLTRFAGSVSARGGADGGDGGFAEVSGKESLLFVGTADMGAARGRMGALLLDPRDITIDNTGGDDTFLTNDNQVTFGEPDAVTDIFINAATIDGINADATLPASCDIFVNQPILSGNNGRSITMQAGNNITVNQTITTRGGNISLTANDNGGGSATGSGARFINAA